MVAAPLVTFFHWRVVEGCGMMDGCGMVAPSLEGDIHPGTETRGGSGNSSNEFHQIFDVKSMLARRIRDLQAR